MMSQNHINFETYTKNSYGRRLWRKIISVLACIVVFCTTYALILPAITLSDVSYCGINEHTHTLSCFSNPDADLETKAEWEKTIPNELTGNKREDLLQVAKSQLGYKESENNYIVTDKEEKKGYTRYGAWYGKPYEDWDAMFVSFCLTYAGIDSFPLESNSNDWFNKLKISDLDCFRHSSDYVPTYGDIIFLDFDSDGMSNQVGIVSDIVWDENENIKQVTVIEGNSKNNTVDYVTYQTTDAQIMGYMALLQMNQDTKLIFEDDSMRVTAIFPKEYEINDNAKLVIDKIDSKIQKTEYDAMSQSVRESLISDNEQILSHLDLYSIQLCVNEEIIDISEDVQVKITVEYKDSLFTEEELEFVSDIAVVMVTQSQHQMLADSDSGSNKYTISKPGATVNEIENGVSSFSFHNDGLQTFGIATITKTRTGNVWKRLKDFSELNNGDILLIVSIEGNVALTQGDSTCAIPVSLEQVKGNPDYYDITDRNSNDSFSQANKFLDSKFIVSNIGTNKFNLLSQGKTKKYLALSNSTVFSNTSTSLSVLNDLPENAWKIYNNKYYLSYERDEVLKSSNNSKNARRDMYIFRLVNTSLEVPEDCVNFLNPPQIPEEPIYNSFTIPTDELEGSTTIKGIENLKVDYASDQSTSDIETMFTITTEDDGKVLTDKSVIYGSDDYGAFSKYENGEFGITLSALGQVSTEKGEIKPVMDVVIILDTSYSMINNGSHYLDEYGKVRMEWAMPAVNKVLHEIMQVEENRVGLVTFSDTSQVVLPLDHYTTKDGQYLDLVADNSITDVNHGRGNNFYDLNINSNVKNSKGETPSFDFLYGPGQPNWEGTFTQSGIAEAANILLENNDTTDHNGNPRQPVIILISDGGPTLSSSNYKAPLDGPIYGNSGQTAENDADESHSTNSNNGTGVNRYGINGYYTVLTAQYYKNLVGSHYDLQTKFASVGIGIDATQNSSTDKRLHDNRYCRAVLNPSPENLADAVNTFDNFTDEGQQFIDLLNNNFSKQYVSIPNHSNGFTTIGTTYSAMPVIKNPYKDKGYAYCDIYFTGKNNTLAQDLISYLKSVQHREHIWRKIIDINTDVEIVDKIGVGMELKSSPVLRFGNKNYTPVYTIVDGNTTTYVYGEKDVSGNVIPIEYSQAYPQNENSNNKPSNTLLDLTTIRVTVISEGEGGNKLQSIKLFIPEELLPIIYPERYGNFYYREDPIRLIYQVGLSKETIEACKNIKMGESKVFYTNRWDEQGSVFSEANFVRYYGDDNPNNYPFANLPLVKKDGTTSANPTETYDFSFACEVNGNIITQKLGNNGRLVIAHDTTTLNVEKRWSDSEEHNPIIVHLLADGKQVDGRTITLSKDNQWKYTWKSLPKYNEQGKEIVYTVSEEFVPGYKAESVFYKAGDQIEIYGWVKSTGFETGKDYVLLSSSAEGYKALAGMDSGKFAWVDFTDFSSKPENTRLIWTRKQNNKLYNNGTQKNMGYGGSNSNRYFTSDGDDAINYSNNTLTFSLSTWISSTTYYFSNLDTNYYASAKTNLSSAVPLSLYSWEKTTETIPEDVWIITNTKTDDPLSLILKKVDNYQIPLSGAKFILYKESASGEVIPGSNGLILGTIINSNIAVDAKGETQIYLPKEDGTYYLAEVVAPDEYTLLSSPIKIVLLGDVIQIDKHEMADLQGNILTVINKKGFEFPNTGGDGTNKYIWGGVTLMVLAVLIFIKNFLKGEKR